MLEHYACAIPIFVLTMLIEYAIINRDSTRTATRRYQIKDTATSIGMGTCMLIIGILIRLPLLALYGWLYQYRLLDAGDGILAWVAIMILSDLAYYCVHRSHHRVRLLWASHVSHHSSQHYNLSTALRQSWTEQITEIVFYAPLLLLGFHPVMVLTAQAFSLFYQYGVHTETVRKLGPLEWIFNTPSHHRVHHAVNTIYLDRNYGGILIIWDRLFGTFQPESENEPVVYGLTKNIDSHNLFYVAFHEWKAVLQDAVRAPTFGDAMRTLFKPPGWSADGSTLTSDQMRAL